MALTVAFISALLATELPKLWSHLTEGSWPNAVGLTVVLVIALFLLYGSVVYQVTRLGYTRRRQEMGTAAHRRRPLFRRPARAPLTVLVPSYKEESDVIYQTVMSAALQEYPERRVVLLIDDPPVPSTPEDARQLAEARSLPIRVNAILTTAAEPLEAAAADFVDRLRSSSLDSSGEMYRLADLWSQAGSVLARLGGATRVCSHTDRFFVDEVLLARSTANFGRARNLLDRANAGQLLLIEEITEEYEALVALFRAHVTSFERKRYTNLSHAPNKAMNLNSYISLLGGRFYEREDGSEVHLVPADSHEQADIIAPAADYVLTLDADSILLPNYASQLVELLERPGNERVGVAQTPYSAIPGACGRVEVVAGATTDLQYLIHQGFTRHGATYWVGANALIRHAALADIAVPGAERGFPITRYIQDRTVIEDTESSVDLISEGWQLYNHPERLAYSATPSDFGSLAIQRGRWANGGLIILPKLVRYLGRAPLRRGIEGLLRVHYLVSIAAVNVGLVILLAGPLGNVTSPLLPFAALPYFVLYGRDLVLSGYRATDLVRVYVLNLLLVPVNLAGVVGSIRQMRSGRAVPFRRTPKVTDRTPVAPGVIVMSCALACWWTIGAIASLASGAHWQAVFSAVNAALLVGGVGYFIGHRTAWSDLRDAWTLRSTNVGVRGALAVGPAAAD